MCRSKQRFKFVVRRSRGLWIYQRFRFWGRTAKLCCSVDIKLILIFGKKMSLCSNDHKIDTYGICLTVRIWKFWSSVWNANPDKLSLGRAAAATLSELFSYQQLFALMCHEYHSDIETGIFLWGVTQRQRCVFSSIKLDFVVVYFSVCMCGWMIVYGCMHMQLHSNLHHFRWDSLYTFVRRRIWIIM